MKICPLIDIGNKWFGVNIRHCMRKYSDVDQWNFQDGGGNAAAGSIDEFLFEHNGRAVSEISWLNEQARMVHFLN